MRVHVDDHRCLPSRRSGRRDRDGVGDIATLADAARRRNSRLAPVAAHPPAIRWLSANPERGTLRAYIEPHGAARITVRLVDVGGTRRTASRALLR
jgi:hypothetical protein